MDVSKNKKNKKTKWVFGLIVGVVVLGVVAAPLLMPRDQAGYQEISAERGSLSAYYTFSGTVEAKVRETVRSSKAIEIDELKVEVGDVVKKEDILLVTTQGEEIKAPLDGEVSNIMAEEDRQVMEGAELLKIVDYSDLQTSMKVGEYDLKSVSEGKEVNITISALSAEVKGIVASLSKEAVNENGVAYFTAEIDLDENKDIRAGMSAEAKMLNESVAEAISLPMDAVRFDGNDNPYVLKLTNKGETKRKYIKTGINDGVRVEIKEGLTNGEKVLIDSKEKGSVTGGFMPPRPTGISPSGEGGQ
jgi:multidrug efflux pump subunit AcrA (membrane-fusion protein)